MKIAQAARPNHLTDKAKALTTLLKVAYRGNVIYNVQEMRTMYPIEYEKSQLKLNVGDLKNIRKELILELNALNNKIDLQLGQLPKGKCRHKS